MRQSNRVAPRRSSPPLVGRHASVLVAHSAPRPSPNPTAAALAIARQTLPPATAGLGGTGTTGGSAADDAHVVVVRNRAELIAALGGDNATNGTNATPKIIFVGGGIDAATSTTTNSR